MTIDCHNTCIDMYSILYTVYHIYYTSISNLYTVYNILKTIVYYSLLYYSII